MRGSKYLPTGTRYRISEGTLLRVRGTHLAEGWVSGEWVRDDPELRFDYSWYFDSSTVSEEKVEKMLKGKT
jgi:hypothetical protein